MWTFQKSTNLILIIQEILMLQNAIRNFTSELSEISETIKTRTVHQVLKIIYLANLFFSVSLSVCFDWL